MAIKTGDQITAQQGRNLLKTFSLIQNGGASTLGFSSDVSFAYFIDDGATQFFFEDVDTTPQSRDITSDWAAADRVAGAVLQGAYLYVFMRDNGTTSYRCYRYDKTNISAGGTLMTFSGQTTGTAAVFSRMTSDGTNFYFNGQAGNSTSIHIISKYTVSGTTFTFVSDTTCASTSINLTNFLVDASGNYYGLAVGSDNKIRRYNSSGTLQATSIAFFASDSLYRWHDSSVNYIGVSGIYYKFILP